MAYKVDDLYDRLTSTSVELPIPDTLITGGKDKINEIVPKSPGIYAIFYADTRKCLYVGSSTVSICKRLYIHYTKDVTENYKELFYKLQNPWEFRFWFYELRRPTEKENLQKFKCRIIALEAICSASWNPEVKSSKF